MSKKNTAATTATLTAAEFKQKSYDAYLAYVEFIEGKKSILETVEALSPLMSAYGNPAAYHGLSQQTEPPFLAPYHGHGLFVQPMFHRERFLHVVP